MPDSSLFPRNARVFVFRHGPVAAIRASIARRAMISILFWIILLTGIIIVIVQRSWVPAALAVGFAMPFAIWGQYWRDVDKKARDFLQVALAEVFHEMRQQGIDPMDTAQCARFDPTNLTGMRTEYWNWVQEYLSAEDVQRLVAIAP